MHLQTYHILFLWVINTAAAYHLHQIVYGRYKNVLSNNVPSAPSNILTGGLNEFQKAYGSAKAQANTLTGILRNPGNSNPPGVLGSIGNFPSHVSSDGGNTYGGNTFSKSISSHGVHSGGNSGYQYSSTQNSNFGTSSYSTYGGQGQRPYKSSYPVIDCHSDVLSCVPDADCENNPYKGTMECPPHFKKLGGACYYFSIAGFVRERSAPDSRKFCEDLGGHLLWLENDNEFESVSKVIAEKGNLIYWSDGFYNKRKDQWEWYNNTQKVDIKRLHYESYVSKPGLTSPSPNAQCLLVGSGGIDAGHCYSLQPFVCKIGEFTNFCERSSYKKCCWTPSYEFYHTSRLGLTPTTIGSFGKSTCYVLFDMEVVTCEEAFKSLGFSSFRVKKSIYYLKSADLGCGKDLEAVITSEDLHRNIVHLMMLRELSPFKIKIGLKFQPSTYSGSFVWSNGKSLDYYEVKHWGSGQPVIHGASSCVMYQLTGHYGSYLWHTQSDTLECTHPNNYVLCELPIRNKAEEPVKKEEGCGIRKPRGALARSFLGNHDYEEAKLGEMPWHVAIQRVVVHSGRVRQEFLCSGVLVSKNSILTSAHCVQGRQRELVVSLGENDLLSGSRRKLLQPVSRTVQEVVIHPEYTAGENDLAILHLSLSVDISSLPHVSTTCLPDQQLLNNPGEWECLATGWQTSASYRPQVLHRIEVEFVSKQVCSRHTSHQSEHSYYGQQKSNEQKLLCTEPWDSTTCLDDPTQILICKKATSSNRQDPFNTGSHYGDTGFDHDIYPGGTQTEQYRHEGTNIINTYGENRYNVDRWYIIGLGYKASKCEGHNQVSVFTPVHEFLAFIHASIDNTHRSPVISSIAIPKNDGFSFSSDLPIKIPEDSSEKIGVTSIAPGFSFTTDLPNTITEQTTESIGVTTIGPVPFNLQNLVTNGEILASRLVDLKKIEKVLGAVKAMFDLFKSAIQKYSDKISDFKDISNSFRRKRSFDTDIDSILQKLTVLQNPDSQSGKQLLDEIEEIIKRLKNFIIAIELRRDEIVDDSIVQKVKERILIADSDLTLMINVNKENITPVQSQLDTINDAIRNLGGVAVTVPQDDSTESLVAAVKAAKTNVEDAANLFKEALAEIKRAETATEEAADAAEKAAEVAAQKADEEEAARKLAEDAVEAARKEQEAEIKKEKEEEAARVAENAEKARKEKEKAAVAAEKAAEVAAQKADEEEAARKLAEEAMEAARKAEEAKIKKEEEEAKIKKEEEEAKIKKEEEEAKIKKEEEEEAKIKKEEEEAKIKKEEEEAKIKKEKEEEAARVAENAEKARKEREEAEEKAQMEKEFADKEAAIEAEKKAEEAVKKANDAEDAKKAAEAKKTEEEEIQKAKDVEDAMKAAEVLKQKAEEEEIKKAEAAAANLVKEKEAQKSESAAEDKQKAEAEAKQKQEEELAKKELTDKEFESLGENFNEIVVPNPSDNDNAANLVTDKEFDSLGENFNEIVVPNPNDNAANLVTDKEFESLGEMFNEIVDPNPSDNDNAEEDDPYPMITDDPKYIEYESLGKDVFVKPLDSDNNNAKADIKEVALKTQSTNDNHKTYSSNENLFITADNVQKIIDEAEAQKLMDEELNTGQQSLMADNPKSQSTNGNHKTYSSNENLFITADDVQKIIDEAEAQKLMDELLKSMVG